MFNDSGISFLNGITLKIDCPFASPLPSGPPHPPQKKKKTYVIELVTQQFVQDYPWILNDFIEKASGVHEFRICTGTCNQYLLSRESLQS